jgi:diguanylate cyclase (GGDEF)-like protein
LRTFLKHLFKNPARARFKNLPMIVKATVFVVLVCLSLVMLDGWRTYSARLYEMKIAETTTANLARALAQHADDTIKSSDTALVGLIERLEVDGISASRERLHTLLIKHVAELPQLHGIFVYDSEGNWVVNSLPVMPANMNNSDREYFIYHRTNANRQPYISIPVRSRSTGQWIITLSRRINYADGSFAGVALATIDMNYFQKYYDNFDIGRSGVIFLALDNGTYLARRPFDESLIGKSLRSSRLFNEFLPKSPVGTAVITSLADGIERLYAYHRLKEYPIVAFAAMSTDEIYGKWRTDTFQRSVIVILISLILGWMGFRLIRQIQFREQAEAELRNAQNTLEILNKRLEKLALEDGLTGLANRRQFDETIICNFKQAIRNSSPLSLLMIDVDHFKHFNDIYGHPSGDDCLRTISRVISETIKRPNDLAARYGGEEIAVLLPDTPQDGALKIAEKIRQAIYCLEIKHSGNYFGYVTISTGISTIVPTINSSALDLVQSADKALYQAKNSGRNVVCFVSGQQA